jgi:hypothetical protein
LTVSAKHPLPDRNIAMATVQRTILPAAVASLLACALIPASGSAQQVYKWTDANGQVHYTDQPPPDRAAASVAVDKSPPPPPPRRTPENQQTARNEYESVGRPSAPADNRSGADWRIAAINEDYQRREAEARREAETAARKKAADDAVIAACERAHDTQCNKGADFIKKREEDLARWQYIDRHERWIKGGRVGPRPPEPPRPEPRVLDSKKK